MTTPRPTNPRSQYAFHIVVILLAIALFVAVGCDMKQRWAERSMNIHNRTNQIEK